MNRLFLIPGVSPSQSVAKASCKMQQCDFFPANKITSLLQSILPRRPSVKKLYFVSISFIFLFTLFGVTSVADYYETPMLKANWEAISSKTLCHLKHDIPFYGSANFIHRSGEPLQFSIQERRFKPQVVKANLTAMPSPWQHQEVNPQDYLVYLDQPVDIRNYGRLAVYGDAAETMIDALLAGQYPTFTYVRATSELEVVETRVAVSGINFFDNYEQFLDCRSQLLPYGIMDFQDKVVYFRAGSKHIPGSARQEIKKLVSYMKEIQDTNVVFVSETAIAGKADKKWFVKRADNIVKELLKHGINKDRLAIQTSFSDADRKDSIRLHVFGPDALTWFFYRKGNTRLNRTEKQRLDLLARYILEFNRQSSLVINSHTDSKGSRAANKSVSKQRGNEIKRYLESKGVRPASMQVKAYGESKPIRSNRTPKGRAKNRRVEIAIRS